MGGISNTLALVQLVLSLLELVPALGQTPTRIPLGELLHFHLVRMILHYGSNIIDGTVMGTIGTHHTH